MALFHWPETRKYSSRLFFMLVMTFCACSIALSGQAMAAEKAADRNIPPRYGLGLSLGLAYLPSDARNFMNITGFALYDYEDIWPHRAPQQLRFKVEASLGGTLRSDTDVMASAGFLALYYFDGFRTRLLRPFGEAGVGIIYTDYKVRKQGSRLNFNPQAGLGLDITPESGPDFWTSIRLHHLSNAGLKKDNRGVNSLVFQLGIYF